MGDRDFIFQTEDKSEFDAPLTLKHEEVVKTLVTSTQTMTKKFPLLVNKQRQLVHFVIDEDDDDEKE